jgi:hypothetical protein
MTELRVYLPIEDLQPQFAAYLSSPTRARGYPPFAGQNSLFIEVAPALAIHRITDLALKSAPSMEPGILYTERQFGLLELHSDKVEELAAAGEAILAGIGSRPEEQLKPQILYHDIIEDLSDQHAVILNRSRDGSILVPGVALPATPSPQIWRRSREGKGDVRRRRHGKRIHRTKYTAAATLTGYGSN